MYTPNCDLGVDYASSNNAVQVSGAGSVLSVSGFWVGMRGSGNQLTITNGGTVINFGESHVGGFGSDNAVLVTGLGSVWSNSSGLYLGSSGNNNKLTITNGGQVFSSYGYVRASSNAVLVIGATSVWSNSESLSVGFDGSGNKLTVANSGRVFNTSGIIGSKAGDNSNVVLVAGTGSLWNNSGSLYVGDQGVSNQLTVTSGGTVIATGLFVGAQAPSFGNTVQVNGGNVIVTNAAGGGALDVRRGTLTLNSGTVTVNRLLVTNGANSLLTFNGGTLNSGSSLISNGVPFTVGDGSSTATLNLQGGAHTFADGLNNQSNASVVVANNATATFGGVVTNAAGSLFHVENSTVRFASQFYNSGRIQFDPSTGYFQNITLGTNAVLTADAGSSIYIQGNFDNRSTNRMQNDFSGQFIFGGTGTGTNDFEVAGINRHEAAGSYDFSGFSNNFAFAQLWVTNNVRFVNLFDNGGGLGTNESLYVDVFKLDESATLNLSNLTIYIGHTFTDGSQGFSGPQVINEANVLSTYGLNNVKLSDGGQIIFIPEPSAGALLALGLGGLAARRRCNVKLRRINR